MIRYDYTDYDKLLDSFDFREDSYNPNSEHFRKYIKILETFDPVARPPEPRKKKQYIVRYIVPVLKEYCRDLRAVLEIEEGTRGVHISIISKCFIIIDENVVFKAVLSFATLFTIQQQKDKIKLELYFATS